jgi:hypothetical protein
MAGNRQLDLTKLAAKYAARAGGAGQYYIDGVNNTTLSQSGNAIAAKDRWAQGVAIAVQNDLFAKGLTKSGDQKWKANAAGKGGQRFASGAQAAAPSWAAGFAPSAQILDNIQLPPRMPRGDPGNAARSQIVQQALHAQRLKGA